MTKNSAKKAPNDKASGKMGSDTSKKLVSLKMDYAFKELFSRENVRKQFLSDVLGIPLDKIKSVRITSPRLWKAFGGQKEGVLDMAMELNSDADVNAELQVRLQKHWTKRQLFYLAKMYTGGLRVGHNYDKLRRCISISILDFNLTEGDESHTEYRLRSKNGTELTDLFEIHVIELRKQLSGTDAVSDWIRLFNAGDEEDLKMIMSKNAGMTEAMEVLRTMSLSKTLRYLYEERLKAIRDRNAQDEYVRDEGIAIGEARGKVIGEARGMAMATLQLLDEIGDVPTELADKIMAEQELDTVKNWLATAAKSESIRHFRELSGL